MGETYKGNKVVTTKEVEDIVSSIEILVKALGTMVLMPDYKSDPNVIGSKIYNGNIQQPILLDEGRKQALAKLEQLIEQL